MSDKPELYYALESLPALITRRDCLLLLEALNAREYFTPADWAGAKMGDVIATLIHRRAEDRRKAAQAASKLFQGLI